MRFIKRVIFIIILLVIAFFIYRLISPSSANDLLLDLKSFSNRTIGTSFTLTGTLSTASGTLIETTGSTLDMSGIFDESTGDELMLSATGITDDASSGSVVDAIDLTGTAPTSIISGNAPVATQTSQIIQKASSKGLSAQDRRDTNHILQGFGH